MKVAERHCHDSNYAGPAASAACSGGDEVATRYQYNHDNLLLTSVATTVGNKTLRTCYRYDDYGNKIGETQPKGAMNCN
jgi:YD repeat-containing protein